MWRVLAQLWHEEFQCQSDIAELTSIDLTTLSRLLKTIETMGLITRTRSSENARVVRVATTPKGRALTRRIIPLAHRYEMLAVGAIRPEKIDALKDLLTEIYGNISAYHRELARRSRKPSGRTKLANRERKTRPGAR